MPDRRQKVRLTHKFAERVDGIDLSGVRPGEEIELRQEEARLLILEGWAAPVPDAARKGEAADRPARRKRRPAAKPGSK